LNDAEAVLALNPVIAAMFEPYSSRMRIVPWGMDAARLPWPVAQRPEAGETGRAGARRERGQRGGETYGRAGGGVVSCRGYYLDRCRGDFDEAIKNLTLAEHPIWPPNAYLDRGIIYARLGRPDRALADFKKLIEIVKDTRPEFFGLEDFVVRRLVFLWD
jgi:tetratricopeptide (TPR) repeat protein